MDTYVMLFLNAHDKKSKTPSRIKGSITNWSLVKHKLTKATQNK